ncbi:N-acyl amino acid synthase FeeM domain-containing protein [Halarcobacter ebronensis]|uniref:N-acyl amino acid synthase FeeM catalytic core domain-containing protein n=1 Tax=Halarcobacter ebronensis TaxID=1462615 RepID=A0A4Q1AU66_9BACT|nr:hypothetical protein [Halarcobacter ebronensis]QKF83253.1 hypothetical protein AEBR_2799 [Halarcobacter ebronensis]RXK05113.1 hypothetical protein CRV07_08835 [Halarcobacter ebronensis]
MVNINKNISLFQLQELLEANFQQKSTYLPEGFYKEQQKAIEIFNKRIFLEKVIDETISFNKKLVWTYEKNNLKLTKTAEELIEVFKLRSDVYTDINYQHEFPDTIEGLNFDKFDMNSAVIYYQKNKEVTASIRLIFDSKENLPTEGKVKFDDMRKKYNTIGEISRNVVKYRNEGLHQEFKYLMCGIYNIFINNDIDIALSGIRKDHLKLFKKLGGVEIYKEMEGYGSLDVPFLIISYNPEFASKFFKKVFLEQ